MPPNNLRKPVAKFTDFIRFTLNKMLGYFPAAPKEMGQFPSINSEQQGGKYGNSMQRTDNRQTDGKI